MVERYKRDVMDLPADLMEYYEFKEQHVETIKGVRFIKKQYIEHERDFCGL